jgi:hypothetical protein
MEIKQFFISYNNPKGNAKTEKIFRTLLKGIVFRFLVLLDIRDFRGLGGE